MENESKIIMITGATSGIGVAVIREFLSLYSGCYFILVSRNRKRMRERIESDSDIKDRIRYEIVETDLCDLHKSEEILEPRIREKGRVDILVNVAGGFICLLYTSPSPRD